MIAIVVVHYNTADFTIACLRSISEQWNEATRVHVVDNGSRPDEWHRLQSAFSGARLLIHWIEAGRNLGFAGGCNLGIQEALKNQRTSHVLLLNSDAVLEEGALSEVFAYLARSPSVDMLGARVHKLESSGEVDSLGIVMYASGLASNRLDASEPLIGPTGGFALYSRRLIDRLTSAHGQFFDEDFFCYAEDTDVAWRALLAGFQPEFLDVRLALHAGQASSGGGFNEFVLYHGIRNSLWVAAKGFPASMLIRILPRAVLLHGGIMLRHSFRGHFATVLRLYAAFLWGLPGMLAKRRRILGDRRRSSAELRRYISPRFYEGAYLRQALRELFSSPKWAGRRRRPRLE